MAPIPASSRRAGHHPRYHRRHGSARKGATINTRPRGQSRRGRRLEAVARRREAARASAIKALEKRGAETRRTRSLRLFVVIALVAGVLSGFTFFAPRVQESAEVGGDLTVTIAPPAGVGLAGHTALARVQLQEERDFLQEIGIASREPYLRVWLVLTAYADNALSDEEITEWSIALSGGINAVRGLAVEDAGLDPYLDDQDIDLERLVAVGPWIEGDGGLSINFSLKPYPLGEYVFYTTAFDLKIDPPVATRELGEEGWVEGWTIRLDTVALNGAGDGTSDVFVCKSCDIAVAYNGPDEQRSLLSWKVPIGSQLTVEVDTVWRPWNIAENLILWMVGTVVAALLGVAITWAIASRNSRG